MARRSPSTSSQDTVIVNMESHAHLARSHAHLSRSQAHRAQSQADHTQSLLNHHAISSTSGEAGTPETSHRPTPFSGLFSAPGPSSPPTREAQAPSPAFSSDSHPRPGFWASTGSQGSSAWSARSGHQPSYSSGSSSRTFAPGLSIKKAKVDPYDPAALLAANDEYTFLKHKQHAEVRGTWTTIDPKSERRNFDGRWHEQRRQAASASGSIASGTQTPTIGPSGRASSAASTAHDVPNTRWPPPSSGPSSASNEPPGRWRVDERFENPDLDVDPDVRAEFRPIGEVLRERIKPRSVVEERNARVAPPRAAAPTLKVDFGGGVSKTMERMGDVRGEAQDRYGKYIGADLGQMKKYLQEERQALIWLRDEEMVRRTREKRAWDALSAEEKERQLAKQQAPVRAFALALDAEGFDVFEYDEIPDIYTKRVTTDQIAAWSRQANTQSIRSITTTDQRFFEGDLLSSEPETPRAAARVASRPQTSDRSASTTEPSSRQRAKRNTLTTDSSSGTVRAVDKTTTDSSSGTVRAVGKTTTIPTPTSSTPIGVGRASRTTSTRSSSRTRFGEPKLAPLADILDVVPCRVDESAADRYDCAKKLCLERGRVVIVALHEMVTFSPSSVMSRVFGGVIQEIQLHPRERMAIVVFLFPTEAEAFVRHATTMQERDPPAYRRLQLDAEWYGGEERTAIMPIQKKVIQAVIGEAATRVLKLERIPLSKKREQLADELKTRLGKILVNVALVRDPKRHVQHNRGNSAIIEFVSVKDAYESRRRFQAGLIEGYEDKPVSWLHDPCDQSAPKSKHCRCINCMEE